MTIDSDEEWDRFVEAAKNFPPYLAWTGARKKSQGDARRWVWEKESEGNQAVDPDYFAKEQMNNGQAYGAFRLPQDIDKNASDNYPKGGLHSMPSYSWHVRGLIVEYTPGFSSSYILNGWARGDHPQMQGANSEKFYRTMDEADGEVPLLSEGTGPLVMPRASDKAPKDLYYGSQSGQGLSRLCIDRYNNRANHVALMDGSVSNVGFGDLWKMKWHRGWQPPNSLPKMPKQ